MLVASTVSSDEPMEVVVPRRDCVDVEIKVDAVIAYAEESILCRGVRVSKDDPFDETWTCKYTESF